MSMTHNLSKPWRWHPRPSVYDKPISAVRAEQAMREGDALREMLSGRRVLEACPAEAA